MSQKRWFLSAPTWAITNFEAIRTAAIAAKVTLVDASLKLDQETEAPGKPAEVLDPTYVKDVLKPAHLAPSYSEVAEVRNRLQSYYAGQNQARVAAGLTPDPMPTTAQIEDEAREIIRVQLAGGGGVNPARVAFDPPQEDETAGAGNPSTEPSGEGVNPSTQTEDDAGA